MKTPQKHITLLQRWLRGDTSRSEERRLEKLAEDDPFLAEALEGYRRFPEGEHQEKLEGLHSRLPGQSRRRKGFIFYLPRIAAALALLVIALGGFWLLNGPAGNAGIALDQKMETETLPNATPRAEENTPSLTEAEKKTETSVEEEMPAFRRMTAESNEQQRPPQPSQLLRKPSPETPEPMAPATDETAGIAALEEKEPEVVEEIPVPPPAAETRKEDIARISPAAGQAAPVTREVETDALADEMARKEEVAPPTALLKDAAPAPRAHVVEGKVTSADGEALIGANVLIPGTNQGTVTDFDGNFRIEIPEDAGQLQISYTGFTSQNIQVGPEDSLINITLDESGAALSEVVVTGYGVKRARKATASQSLSTPYPRGGFDKMKEYIQKNLQYPAEARKNGIQGKVILEFTTNERGKPQDIRVVQSLGYGCDEEAVRLLEKGPRWRNTTPGEAVRYAVDFRLTK